MHRETFEHHGIVHVLEIHDYDEKVVEDWKDAIREKYRKALAGLPGNKGNGRT